MEAFLIESEETLSEIDHAALALESGTASPDTLNQLFRAFHNLKGSSAMMGLPAIVDFAHHVENLLDLTRRGEIPISPKLVDLVLRSGDQIASLLAVERGHPPPDPRLTQKLVEDLCGLANLPVNAEPVAADEDGAFLF